MSARPKAAVAGTVYDTVMAMIVRVAAMLHCTVLY
jgi:hypothetical protein